MCWDLLVQKPRREVCKSPHLGRVESVHFRKLNLAVLGMMQSKGVKLAHGDREAKPWYGAGCQLTL